MAMSELYYHECLEQKEHWTEESTYNLLRKSSHTKKSKGKETYYPRLPSNNLPNDSNHTIAFTKRVELT